MSTDGRGGRKEGSERGKRMYAGQPDYFDSVNTDLLRPCRRRSRGLIGKRGGGAGAGTRIQRELPKLVRRHRESPERTDRAKRFLVTVASAAMANNSPRAPVGIEPGTVGAFGTAT